MLRSTIGLLGGVAVVFIGACSSDGPSQQTATKRLYQTGCAVTSDCEGGAVCKSLGAGTACLPACSGTCTGGSCEGGACVPTCAAAVCPGELVCGASMSCVVSAGAMDAGEPSLDAAGVAPDTGSVSLDAGEPISDAGSRGPVILSFTAMPSSVEVGGTIDLSWSTQDAFRVVLGGPGVPTSSVTWGLSGSTQVIASGLGQARFFITATGIGTPANSEVTVNVVSVADAGVFVDSGVGARDGGAGSVDGGGGSIDAGGGGIDAGDGGGDAADAGDAQDGSPGDGG